MDKFQIGMFYGDRVVASNIFYKAVGNSKRKFVKLRCKCGNLSDVNISMLLMNRSNQCKSCSNSKNALKQSNDRNLKYLNKTINYLTILDFYIKGSVKYCKCICKCGNELNTSLNSIIQERTKSCGCFKLERLYKHGKSKTRIYKIYNSMKNRCNNPNVKAYKNYGAKGIKIEKDFNTLNKFVKWSLDNGYYEQDSKQVFKKDMLCIDRIDPDKGYYPNNCQWITFSENAKRVSTARAEIKQKEINFLKLEIKELKLKIEQLKTQTWKT